MYIFCSFFTIERLHATAKVDLGLPKFQGIDVPGENFGRKIIKLNCNLFIVILTPLFPIYLFFFFSTITCYMAIIAPLPPSAPVPTAAAPAPHPQPAAAAGAQYAITPPDHVKYHGLFLSYDANRDG